jgi:hypothetical protein
MIFDVGIGFIGHYILDIEVDEIPHTAMELNHRSRRS